MSTAAGAADKPGQGAVVVWAEGPDNDLADAKASAEVSANPYLVLIDRSKYQAELARQGHRGALAPDLKDARKRVRLLERLRRSGRNMQVDEVVIIVTHRAGLKASADLLVVDAAASDSPTETRLPLSGDSDSLSRAMRESLPHEDAEASESVAATESPAAGVPASPPRDVQPTRDSIDAAARPLRHRVGDDALELSAAVGAGMRHFAYKDGITANLRPYDLTAAPVAAADGALYPFALAGSPTKLLTDVGVVFGYARAFALQSTSVETSSKLNTQWSRYYVGGRARIRTGPEGSPMVGLEGAYGGEGFAFDRPPNAPPLPSVDYRFVRASGDLRVPFGRAAVVAGAGYLFVLSVGDLASRFPRASVGGIEAELGGAFALAAGFEARLTASYRRFFYAMNPTIRDAYIAGGALDELGTLQAGVAYAY